MRTLAAALLCVTAFGAAAQANPDAVLSGTLRDTGAFGYDETTTVTCRGIPTCSGTWTVTVRHENCTTFNTYSGQFIATGLNLTASGTISGTVTFHGVRDAVNNP